MGCQFKAIDNSNISQVEGEKEMSSTWPWVPVYFIAVEQFKVTRMSGQRGVTLFESIWRKWRSVKFFRSTKYPLFLECISVFLTISIMDYLETIEKKETIYFSNCSFLKLFISTLTGHVKSQINRGVCMRWCIHLNESSVYPNRVVWLSIISAYPAGKRRGG